MKNFIYFPSFSVGSYTSTGIRGNSKFRNDLPFRFFSDEFPEKYRHPYFLVTAGHFYDEENYSEAIGLRDYDDVKIMGDSGGFQIISGAIEWNKNSREILFKWLERNSDVAMNIDFPPRGKFEGKFREALENSYENFKYFAKNQTGDTEFLNVLQGNSKSEFKAWYNKVNEFDFSGWAIGGLGLSMAKFLYSIVLLCENKEHYKKENKWLHILGATKVVHFLMFAQLQKSLNEINSNMTVTTDSSSPSQTGIFGNYYSQFNFKKGLDAIHIPGKKNKENLDNCNILPILIPFDDYLKDAYNNEDFINWTRIGYASLIVHNLQFFIDLINKVNSAIDVHSYILRELIGEDRFQLLQVIDEIIKAYENGTTPMNVFRKYKHLDFYKLSDNINTIEHNFFN